MQKDHDEVETELSKINYARLMRNILIVDNNKNNQKEFFKMLSNKYNVLQAESCSVGLNILQGNK